MVNRRTVVALAAVGTIVAANFLSACVKSGSDDSFFPPTPTPTAPPTTSHCAVVWATQDASDPAGSDALVVDAPASMWLNGPAAIGTDGATTFAEYLLVDVDLTSTHLPDPTSALYVAVGQSSGNGGFTISGMNVNGTTAGAPVTLTDTTGDHLAFTLGTAGNEVLDGSVFGTFTFDGTFNGDLTGPVDTGTGTASATITSMGALSFGDFGAYAGCYTVSE